MKNKSLLSLFFFYLITMYAALAHGQASGGDPGSLSAQSVFTGEQVISQQLWDQDIFFLIGINGTEEEKNNYKNKLDQVVWDDFLINDAPLLLTNSEMIVLQVIIEHEDDDQSAKKQKILDYLATVCPDVDQLLDEKSLSQKEDMLYVRISEMERRYQYAPQALERIKDAKVACAMNRFHDAIAILNEVDEVMQISDDLGAAR
jgi:hypothetical protein